MKYYYYFIIFIILLYCNRLYAYEKYIDFDLIKKVGAPRFVENGILFTMPGEKWDKVFLRTNIDQWQNNYYYQLNYYNILYLFIPYTGDLKQIQYKININGFWETDPTNSEYITDDLNTKISILNIPNEEKFYEDLPLIEDTDNKIKKVEFKYFNTDAYEVNLVCSVDNWNQYSHIMTKNKFGSWEISKYFTKGIYYYYYFVDGKKQLDEKNSHRVWDNLKGQISFFIIK